MNPSLARFSCQVDGSASIGHQFVGSEVGRLAPMEDRPGDVGHEEVALFFSISCYRFSQIP